MSSGRDDVWAMDEQLSVRGEKTEGIRGLPCLTVAAALMLFALVATWGPVYATGNEAMLFFFPLWVFVVLAVEILGFVSLGQWSRSPRVVNENGRSSTRVWQPICTGGVMILGPFLLWFGDLPLVLFGAR